MAWLCYIASMRGSMLHGGEGSGNRFVYDGGILELAREVLAPF